MVLHAEVLSPLRFPAGSRIKVTTFRAHHAEVALGQSLETGIAISLSVTLSAGFPAVLAADTTVENQLNSAADIGVKVILLSIEW